MAERKNQTGRKTLDFIETDARIVRAYHDSDGYWVDLEYGYTADPYGAHDIHEDRLSDVLWKIRQIASCGPCEECADSIAKKAIN